MARPVDMACFSASYLALMRRFPNRVSRHNALIVPSPTGVGVVILLVSHTGGSLLISDAEGFSNGIYEFGLTEEFYGAVGPRHMGQLSGSSDGGLRLAISNGEYRLYQGAGNDQVFDSSHDDAVVFTWAGRISRAGRELPATLNQILQLHQSGLAIPVEESLSSAYHSEVEFAKSQLSPPGGVRCDHAWIRDLEGSVHCLTRYSSGAEGADRVVAIACVNPETALG